MTYRAWEQKPLDRTAVRELTAAIAEQAAAQLEEQAMDEAPWSDENPRERSMAAASSL